VDDTGKHMSMRDRPRSESVTMMVQQRHGPWWVSRVLAQVRSSDDDNGPRQGAKAGFNSLWWGREGEDIFSPAPQFKVLCRDGSEVE
jgi:hypothetical protein